MAIRVAFVKDDGLIQYALVPSDETQYVEGSVIDGLTCRLFSYEENPETFLDTQYWNGTGWSNKPEKPGDYYDWASGSWSFNSERFQSAVRMERTRLLRWSDWTQMPDSPLSAAERADWAIYRQALRDFPATITTETTLEELVWPTAP